MMRLSFLRVQRDVFAQNSLFCMEKAVCQKVLVDRKGESCYSFVDFERHRLAESFQSNLLGTAQRG